MQRYFVPAKNWNENNVVISGDDAHHIIKVMRYKVGDKLICNHQNGDVVVCEIKSFGEHDVLTTIQKKVYESTEMPIHVTIAQGLPKGDKFDFILQKGTELGAAGFIPLQAERSVVKWDSKKQEKKINRFNKIVKEASEQSHRNQIPMIMPVMGINDLIAESENFDIKIVAYEEEAKVKAHQSLGKFVNKFKRNQNVLVCIGPEGGFSVKEITQLKENGFLSVRLGPRILRTETASLYVLASISYHFEELGCETCQQ